MLAEIRKLPGYRELIVNFTLREIKGKYKQAFFGVAWAMIQPIVLMLILTLVFSYIAGIRSDGIPYPVFLFAGLLPWQFFSGALTRGTNALVNQASLITKVYFPRESLVVSSMAAAMVDFGITTLVFIALLIYYRVAPTVHWLWIVPLLLTQMTLALGLMLILAPLNTLYRDVGQAVPLAMQLWMYATPLMYPATLVPASIRPYYFLNPMAVLIEGYRDAIFRNTAPDPWRFLYVVVIAGAVLIAGYSLFKRLERTMADVA
ncbi:MAG TPA: ABC transporter permease [Burkholderiales bacterium]|nr:ABC transporter permease [Burkholderiales bacterium]